MHYYIYAFIGAGIIVVGIVLFLIFNAVNNKKKKKNNKTNPNLSLKNQTDKLGFIFNSIDEGLILIDSNGVINLFNPAAEKITGWEAKDAVGIDIKMVVKLVDNKGEEYSNNSNPFVQIFKLRQNIKDNNAILVTKTNSSIYVNLSVSLVDLNKNSESAVVLIRNVTEERMEEERLVDFISTASHEMRTPVAAIEGYLALALNSKVSSIDDKVRDYLEKAHMATQHLGQLFQDLLTSAKAEDGRLANHPRIIEVGAFLKQLTEELKFAAEKKGLKMEFIVGTDQLAKVNLSNEKNIMPFYYVYADPDRLREVVTNLFDNAVKFTTEGSITIGLTADSNIVQFYVKDTGVGIPAEDIPHLFQKFYRVDNSATRTVGGTGLGLFICKKIVELYNGRIWVESQVKKGSTFYINIPRVSSQQAKSMEDESLNNETELTKNTLT